MLSEEAKALRRSNFSRVIWPLAQLRLHLGGVVPGLGSFSRDKVPMFVTAEGFLVITVIACLSTLKCKGLFMHSSPSVLESEPRASLM